MMKGVNLSFTAKNRAAPVMKQFQRDLAGTRSRMMAASVANRRFSQSLGGSTWRRQVQQAGMQISDFSVQVAGGQSAILAFTQNAPQFIQNFGAMGGIIAAAVTILGTFAFMASRGTLSIDGLSDATGVLSGMFSSLGRAIQAARDAMGPVIQTLLQNLDTLLIAAALTAGYFATKWVGAMLIARVATISTGVTLKALAVSVALIGPSATAAMVAMTALTTALRILRAVLMTLGIPALIIGLAWVIERLMTLRQATGSWGEALSLLGGIASAVWQGMVNSLQKARLNMASSIGSMAADFIWAFSDIARAWDSMVNGMSSFWNEKIAGPMGLGQMGGSNLESTISAIGSSIKESANANAQAADAIGDSFGEAKAKLKELRDLMRSDPITFGSAVAGDDGGGGGGGGSASDKAKEEADKIKKIFEDIQKGISQTLSSSFKALLQGTKTFKDAMVDVLNTILDKVFQLIMTPIFDGLAGTIASGVMKIPGLARGTKNAPGGLTRINERGGEMAVLPGGTQVIPADLSRRMVDNINGGGSRGPMVEVNVVNQSSGTEVKQNRRRGPDGKETVDVIISESIAMGRQDAALNQRLGAKPQTVRR